MSIAEPGERSATGKAGPKRTSWARLFVSPLLIVAVSLLAFSPALQAGFVWDDQLVITWNHDFRGLDAERLGWMATTSRAGHHHPLTWLSLAVDFERFGLDRSQGLGPLGFHATNLWLHALAALALYFLALELLPLAARPQRTGELPPATPSALTLSALAATLFFALHPLRCESVCWVTERRDVLAAPAFLLAVLAHLRANARGAPRPLQRGWLVLSAISAGAAVLVFFAAVSLADPDRLRAGSLGAPGLLLCTLLFLVSLLASALAGWDRADRGTLAWRLAIPLLAWLSLQAKAWAMVLPALLLLLDLFPLRRMRTLAPSAQKQMRAALALILEKAPLLALTAVYGSLASWAQTAQQGNIDVWQAHSLGDRVAQAAYGLLFYPIQTLLPFQLLPLHPIPDELALSEPRFALAAACVLGLSVLLVSRVRRAPALLATWLAYAIIVSPVLGFAQAGPQLVADRYSYLSCIPFALLVGGALLTGLRTRPDRLVLASGCVAIGGALLAALSYGQSGIWMSDETLWEYSYSRGTRGQQTLLNYGVIRMGQAQHIRNPEERTERYTEADQILKEGGDRYPTDYAFPLNRAVLRLKRSLEGPSPERARWLAEAARLSAEAIAHSQAQDLRDVQPNLQHARILRQQERFAGADESFTRAIALEPRLLEARLGLAETLLSVTQTLPGSRAEEALALVRRAESEARAALAIAPHSSDGRVFLATAFEYQWQLLSFLDERDAAEQARRQAIRAYRDLPPNDPALDFARERLERLGASR